MKKPRPNNRGTWIIPLSVMQPDNNYIVGVKAAIVAEDGKSDVHDPNTKTNIRIDVWCVEGKMVSASAICYADRNPLRRRVLTIQNNKLWWSYYHKEYEAINAKEVLKAVKDAL
jgi:hypothetical protein